MSAMPRPPSTSTIGYGRWIRRATNARKATATRSPRTVATAGMASASRGQPAQAPALDAPRRVADERHGRVAEALGLGPPAQDGLSERLGRAAGEAGGREPDRVHDVSVRVARLRAGRGLAQTMRELVEDVEAGCRVLDLDRVEVEGGRQPAHAVDTAGAAVALGAPEGVRGDGESALLVDRSDRGGRRHAGAHPLLQEQPQDVAFPAGDLLADDD